MGEWIAPANPVLVLSIGLVEVRIVGRQVPFAAKPGCPFGN
jgi:hypothetical protein